MTLGEKIKTARIAAGLTQRQLGEACGREGRSGECTVQHWEHNRQEPGLSDIRPLATALKVSIDYLIP